MTTLTHGKNYQDLLEHISRTYTAGRAAALQAVNTQLVNNYWQVGQHIVEFEQGGKDRAEYGAGLITRLAADLCLRHGKGFSRSNLIYMRLLYLRYPIGQMPSDLLSWSHYVELLMLDDPQERGFYERQAIAERWSVSELKRQKYPRWAFVQAVLAQMTTSMSCSWGARPVTRSEIRFVAPAGATRLGGTV